MSFADHFSGLAREYARFRPGYPQALAAFLAANSPARHRAWDCGTGSGQAAVALASEFDQVVATDPSSEQLAHARPHPRVLYRRGSESTSGLPVRSVDLVAAAQAAHWFDLPAFYREARRVLRPGGLVAIWCYGLMTVSPEIDRVLASFYRDRLGRHWPPERRHVDAGYQTLGFPFARVAALPLVIEASLDRGGFLGYLGTWSAVARCRRSEGRDPLDELVGDLERAWPGGSGSRAVQWPLSVLAGRVEPS